MIWQDHHSSFYPFFFPLTDVAGITPFFKFNFFLSLSSFPLLGPVGSILFLMRFFANYPFSFSCAYRTSFLPLFVHLKVQKLFSKDSFALYTCPNHLGVVAFLLPFLSISFNLHMALNKALSVFSRWYLNHHVSLPYSMANCS